MVRETQPDLIILDVMMPRKNGFDVAATLKNDPEFLGIPIIMLTVVDDAQRIYGLGVERYITKPFEPSHIVTEAETLLSQRGEPKIALLLGEIPGKEDDLRDCLSQNGHQLILASNLDALPKLVAEHDPKLLIISGGQYQDEAVQDLIRTTVGRTTVMTRHVKNN